jgi:hypothetical protein
MPLNLIHGDSRQSNALRALLVGSLIALRAELVGSLIALRAELVGSLMRCAL